MWWEEYSPFFYMYVYISTYIHTYICMHLYIFKYNLYFCVCYKTKMEKALLLNKALFLYWIIYIYIYIVLRCNWVIEEKKKNNNLLCSEISWFTCWLTWVCLFLQLCYTLQSFGLDRGCLLLDILDTLET